MNFNHDYSKVSWLRCISTNGFNMNPGERDNIEPEKFNMFLMVSMAEELGEILGAFKKIIRGYNKREFEKTKQKCLNQLKPKAEKEKDFDIYAKVEGKQWIENKDYLPIPVSEQPLYNIWLVDKMKKVSMESADLAIYFDLFLTHNNIDIKAQIKETFNKVSDEMGCPEFKITSIK